MKTVTVVFSKSNKKFNLFSKLIMWWTNALYSHVSIKISTDLLDKPLYFQSSGSKVNWEYQDHFLVSHTVVKEHVLQVDDASYQKLLILCWKSVGEPYGYMQNLGIFLCDILKSINLISSNPWKTGKNCSEIIYLTTIIPVFGDLGYDPNKIKPNEIEEILTTSYKESLKE